MGSTSCASSSSLVSHLLVPRALQETGSGLVFDRDGSNLREDRFQNQHLLGLSREQSFGSQLVLVLLHLQNSAVQILESRATINSHILLGLNTTRPGLTSTDLCFLQ